MSAFSLSKFKSIEEAWFDKIKKGNMMANWQNRYFSMDMDTKILSYYTDDSKQDIKGIIFNFILF